jgi:2-polyprenyl-3-methyl-5-hydroxy-6-metoxy-1,4-benzoquinol methylase
VPNPRYAFDAAPRGNRRLLLERIGRGSEVLDIGCWAGGNGRFLASRGVTVDGVEPEEEMAALARETYREVIGDTVEGALPLLVRKRGAAYDAVLFLDVLEHLVDPWRILREASALLRPGGRAYVSLPNVAHWSLRKELLLGRWDYRDNGLLDRTHLRFFTVATARHLMEGTGWRICWQAADVDRLPLLRLPERWLARLGRWPGLFGVQTLLEARVAGNGQATSR